MAHVLNENINNERYFDSEKEFVDNDIRDNSSGGMNSQIEDNMMQLANAAKASMKKRKPIYDFKTKNKSFLNLYNDLYKLGIKNNKLVPAAFSRETFMKMVKNMIRTPPPPPPRLPIAPLKNPPTISHSHFK